MADLTLEEAARLLGVAASTLRVQLRNGKLRGKKVGPIWTLTPKEVERYRLESRRLDVDHLPSLHGDPIVFVQKDPAADHDHIFQKPPRRR